MSIKKAAATSFILFTVGDITAQFIENNKFDKIRTAKFALIGSLIHGPWFFTAFRLLDKRLGPSVDIKSSIKKALISHIVVFPPYLCLFLGSSAALDGKPVVQNIQSKFIPIFVPGTGFWPLVNIGTFMLPSKYRMIYLNGCGIFWNSFLSNKTRKV